MGEAERKWCARDGFQHLERHAWKWNHEWSSLTPVNEGGNVKQHTYASHKRAPPPPPGPFINRRRLIWEEHRKWWQLHAPILKPNHVLSCWSWWWEGGWEVALSLWQEAEAWVGRGRRESWDGDEEREEIWGRRRGRGKGQKYQQTRFTQTVRLLLKWHTLHRAWLWVF